MPAALAEADSRSNAPSPDILQQVLTAEYARAVYNLSRVTVNGKPGKDDFSALPKEVATLMRRDVNVPEIVEEYRKAAQLLAKAYLNPSELRGVSRICPECLTIASLPCSKIGEPRHRPLRRPRRTCGPRI